MNETFLMPSGEQDPLSFLYSGILVSMISFFFSFFFDCSILIVFAYHCKSLPLLRPLQCSLFVRTHSLFFIHSHLVCLSFPRCFGIPILHVLLFSFVSRTPPTAPLSLGSSGILNIPSLNRGCDILAVAPTP